MTEPESQLVEKKKRFLKRYKKNNACIARLEYKLKLQEERISKIRSSNFSAMPRGSNPITLDELIADKLDLEDRIKKLKKKGRLLRREILTEIDKVEDPRICEILESFFIDCLSLEDIAENEGYNVRHVYRLYSEGVRIIAENEQ